MMKMDNNNEDKSIRLEDLAQVNEVPPVETVKLGELQRVYSPQEIMISQIPYELAKEYCMVPISLREDGPAEMTITVVVADPQNNKMAINHLENIAANDYIPGPTPEEQGWIKYNVRVLTAPEDQIKGAIDRLYEEEAAHERIGKEVLPVLRMMDELDKAGGLDNSFDPSCDPYCVVRKDPRD